MLNYMKSEWYRVTRGKGFYAALAIVCGLVVLMNLVLMLSSHYIPNFRYGTFRFSLNVFTGQSYVMLIMAGILPGSLFLDDRKSGVLKNAVAYGIPREKILLGKYIMGFLFTFLILCAVVVFYVGSAWILLENPEWQPLREMLTGMGALLPASTASLILFISLGAVCQKEMTVAILWAAVFFIVPRGLNLIGYGVDFVGRIASWMPYSFLTDEAIVTWNDYQCLWDTPKGLGKCLASGLIGMAVFTAYGIRAFKKQEL